MKYIDTLSSEEKKALSNGYISVYSPSNILDNWFSGKKEQALSLGKTSGISEDWFAAETTSTSQGLMIAINDTYFDKTLTNIYGAGVADIMKQITLEHESRHLWQNYFQPYSLNFYALDYDKETYHVSEYTSTQWAEDEANAYSYVKQYGNLSNFDSIFKNDPLYERMKVIQKELEIKQPIFVDNPIQYIKTENSYKAAMNRLKYYKRYKASQYERGK
jgi:hypothetical protein